MLVFSRLDLWHDRRVVRWSIEVRGIVQGVGFRPFTLRTARKLRLRGWVKNERDSVRIEAQGDRGSLERFVQVLRSAPAPAHVIGLNHIELPLGGDEAFLILASEHRPLAGASLPADLATCAACLAEVFTPGERRFGYAFTNCTACGPRYTIVERLPYDRHNTSMAHFPMCSACRAEYEDVGDRRYHAEPIACPECGPRLLLVSPQGDTLAVGSLVLESVVTELERGCVVALRGLGGFQLLVDARNESAVELLRCRKRRPDKPFAVMFPDLPSLARVARLKPAERELLRSPRAPIVLIEAGGIGLARGVAPGSPEFGAMLPTTPLHHLLLHRWGGPLICTSGNLGDEPICIDNEEARERLKGIADIFLIHDRPIMRPMDDSLARVCGGIEVLRRARGYAAEPVAHMEGAPALLALGGHFKNTVTLVVHGQCVMSQHLGDLDTPQALGLLRHTVADLCEFFSVVPELIACDRHPDYATSQLARELGKHYDARVVAVQHHHAHIASVIASHGLSGPVVGLAWDGTGLGDDGTIWGGECLRLDVASATRIGHLLPFPLPGGDLAAREPWRAALGLFLAHGQALEGLEVPARSLEAALKAHRAGLNTPQCSSVGRLFDAAAHLILGTLNASFEGQTALALEALARQVDASTGAYPLPLVLHDQRWVGDVKPLLVALLRDRRCRVDVKLMSRRLHEALIAWGVRLVERAGVGQVALSGGCFQNRILREGLTLQLEKRGFRVWSANSVPTNDGGLSLGQAWAAARMVAQTEAGSL